MLGMPIGYGLSVLTSMAYESEMFRFPVISRPETYLWTAVLAILFGLGAHLIVQRNIHRMDWLEALQSKE